MKEGFPPPAQRLEYWKIDHGGKASLNKMHDELPITADLAIKRLQNKGEKPIVHGEICFDEIGRLDVLIFRGDLYIPPPE